MNEISGHEYHMSVYQNFILVQKKETRFKYLDLTR